MTSDKSLDFIFRQLNDGVRELTAAIAGMSDQDAQYLADQLQETAFKPLDISHARPSD